jgi:hypothetical protein
MQGTILTWTRVERPPAGFAPGRIVVLVEADGERRYAHWRGAGDPAIGSAARLEPHDGGWVAR